MANDFIKNKNATKFDSFLYAVARARFDGRTDKTKDEIEQMKREYVAGEIAKIENMPLWSHDIFDEMLKNWGQIEKVATISGDSYFKRGAFPKINLESILEAERADLTTEEGRPFDMFLQDIADGRIAPKKPAKAEKNYFKKFPEEKKAVEDKIKRANEEAKAEFNKINLATKNKLIARKDRKQDLQFNADTFLKGLKGTPDYKIQSALFKRFKTEDKKLLKAEAKFDKANAEWQKQQKLFELGAIKTEKGQKAYEKAMQAYEKQLSDFERLKNGYVNAYINGVNTTDEKLAEQYAMRIHQIRANDFSYTPLKGLDESCEVGCVPTVLNKVNENNVKPVLNEFIKKPIFAEMKMPARNVDGERNVMREQVDFSEVLENINNAKAENETDLKQKVLDRIAEWTEKPTVDDKAKDVTVDEMLANIDTADTNNDKKEKVNLAKILQEEHDKLRETNYEQKIKAVIDNHFSKGNEEKSEPTVGDDLGER